MTKQAKDIIRIAVSVLLLIITAVLLRNLHFFLPVTDTASFVVGLLQSGIYLCMFTVWGFSFRRRIIQTQVKNYLAAISALMVFWLIIRTVKYMFVTNLDIARYLWYLYYLPMLFIPQLVVFVALSLGKSEEYRLPRWTALFCVPTLALLIFVLTNDLHQAVFAFPADITPCTDSDYSYAALYPFVIGWEVICALAAMIIMLTKCRVPHSKKVLLLPFVPLSVSVLYCVLYVTAQDFIHIVAGDITVAQCLFFSAIFECCIACGLIQSNSRYDELFCSADISAQIVDENYNVCYSAEKAHGFTVDIMRQTEAAPLLIDGGARLSSAAIKGGRVLWEEDISELLAVLDELSEAKENMEDSNSLQQAEIALRARETHIAEQDRLYDRIQRDTAPRIRFLSRLIELFEKTADEDERLVLLGKMTVIGAYLKRRSNLILLSDKAELLDVQELERAIAESFVNLELCGIICGFHTNISGRIFAADIMEMYDYFEDMVERSEIMTAITVAATQTDREICFTVNTASATDYSAVASDRISAVRDDDGEWQLTLRIKTGGVADEA